MSDATHPESVQSGRPGPPQAHPASPLTGDAALDEAMTELAHVQRQPFGERIGSGERFHRLLQSRLDDLGRA